MNKLLQTKPKIDYNYGNGNYKKELFNKGNNRVNNKSNIKVARTMIFFLLTLILIGFLLVAYIGQSLHIAHLNFKIEKLKVELKEINDSNHELSLQLARDRSLAKIEEIAKNELKMIEPEKMEIIVLNSKNKNQNSLKELKTDNKFFLARIFGDLLDRLGTVKANSLD